MTMTAKVMATPFHISTMASLLTKLSVVILLCVSSNHASALIAAPTACRDSQLRITTNKLFGSRGYHYFSTQGLRRARSGGNTPTQLFSTPKDDNEEEEDIPLSDSDMKRISSSLNNMIGDDDHNSNSVGSNERNRIRNMEREIKLLMQLDPEHPNNKVDSNDEEEIQKVLLQNQEVVVSKLWSHWYGERGPINERKLRLYEEKLVAVGGSSSWPEVEQNYLGLIHEHCSPDSSDGSKTTSDGREEINIDKLNLGNWVEPANRLATLLFLMGKHSESKAWCEKILAEKPWHIGALSGIVVVCMQLDDKESAIKWALKGLPNLSPQTRRLRSEWVQRNVQEAKQKLADIEEDLRKKMIERVEVSVKKTSTSIDENIGFDDSAWQ